jgi:hypothetical protein
MGAFNQLQENVWGLLRGLTLDVREPTWWRSARNGTPWGSSTCRSASTRPKRSTSDSKPKEKSSKSVGHRWKAHSWIMRWGLWKIVLLNLWRLKRHCHKNKRKKNHSHILMIFDTEERPEAPQHPVIQELGENHPSIHTGQKASGPSHKKHIVPGKPTAA